MFKKTPIAALLGSVLLMGAADVMSYEAGDNILRLGAAMVAPTENSDALELNGVALPGVEANVDNNTQLGITYTYMLADNLGIGVLAATPFEHDLSVNDLGLEAGSIEHLPPSITLQYFFCDNDSAFQPYVGAGVNYTTFFDEDIDDELEAVFGSGDLELDDSVGLALEAGFDYALGDHWLLSAQVWYLDIGTTAEFDFDSGAQIEVDVEIDPWVYMVSVGYKF